MGFWPKRTGGQPASTTPTGRTAKERARRNAEIRKIDAGTANWLNTSFGRGPRKDR